MSEEDLTTSMSGLSLLDEHGGGGDHKEVGGDGKDGGKERERKEGEGAKREDRTHLSAISEGEEDIEKLEWRVSDVFSGLDKDSSRKTDLLLKLLSLSCHVFVILFLM